VGRRVREPHEDATVLALGLEFKRFKVINMRKLFKAGLENIEQSFLTQNTDVMAETA